VPIYEALTDIPQLGDGAKTTLARDEPFAVRYYLIRSGQYDCRSSQEMLRRWQQGRFGRSEAGQNGTTRTGFPGIAR
jgi:hypothetical protein